MWTRLLKKLYLIGGAFVMCVMLPLSAAPTRDPAAKGNDCAACHQAGLPLLAKHPSTQTNKWSDCMDCHEKGTDDTIAGKIPGSHAHQLAGVTCADCHGSSGKAGSTVKPVAVEMDMCLTCHKSGEKMAALTAKVKPQNPHVSAHYNSDLDCNVCHHQHAKSENFCVECHSFGFKVP